MTTDLLVSLVLQADWTAWWLFGQEQFTYRSYLPVVKGSSPFSLKLSDLKCVSSHTYEVASLTVACIQAVVENLGISTDGFGMLRVFLDLRIFLFLHLLFKACKTEKKTQPWTVSGIGIIAGFFPVTRIYSILKTK